MTEHPKVPLWKFWPVAICAVIIGFELFEVYTKPKPVDWFLIIIPAAVAVFVIIVRGFMRVK